MVQQRHLPRRGTLTVFSPARAKGTTTMNTAIKDLQYEISEAKKRAAAYGPTTDKGCYNQRRVVQLHAQIKAIRNAAK